MNKQVALLIIGLDILPSQHTDDIFLNVVLCNRHLERKLYDFIRAMMDKYKTSKNAFVNQLGKLDSLSPLKTLARGYTITQKEGNIIKSVKQLQAGDEIELRYQDGTAEAVVK